MYVYIYMYVYIHIYIYIYERGARRLLEVRELPLGRHLLLFKSMHRLPKLLKEISLELNNISLELKETS